MAEAGRLFPGRSWKASSPPVRGREGTVAEVRSDCTTPQEAGPTRPKVRQSPESQKEHHDRARRPRSDTVFVRDLLFRRDTELRASQRAEFADQMQDFQDTVGQRRGSQ